MLDSASYILDFSDYPDWLDGLKNKTNEYMMQCYLQQNPQFTHLSFFSCGLTDPDLKTILAIVQKCPHIVSLDLANNRFTDSGLKFFGSKLKNLAVRELNLSGNYQLSIPAIHQFLRHLPDSKLTTLKLNLINLHGGCGELFNYIGMSNVSDLEINSTALKAEDAAIIAQKLGACPKLLALDVSANLFNDADIALITSSLHATYLRRLNVSYNQLTPAVLTALARHVHDQAVTEILYDGVDLPAAPLALLDEATDFNQLHNKVEQLTEAFNQGINLRMLDPQPNSTLPTELIEMVSKFSTESTTQHRALLLGWQSLEEKIAKRPVAETESRVAASSKDGYTP